MCGEAGLENWSMLKGVNQVSNGKAPCMWLLPISFNAQKTALLPGLVKQGNKFKSCRSDALDLCQQVQQAMTWQIFHDSAYTWLQSFQLHNT